MDPILIKHIESKPGVCGGKPCIVDTRIRVQDVYVWHELQGKTPDEIVSDFPLDEHVPPAIAEGLRRRGIDVITTSDAGLTGDADVLQAPQRVLRFPSVFVSFNSR